MCTLSDCRIIFIAISCVALFGCAGPTADEEMSPEQFVDHLNEQIPQLMGSYNIPGVCIAVIQDGNIRMSHAYGYADIEKRKPLTTETVFRIESITKSVTAWGIMNLVGQGKIGLDDPVEQFLRRWQFPASEYSSDTITFRQLLSHSGGINSAIYPAYSPDEQLPALEAVLSGVNDNPETRIVREPGTTFLYSNPGFVLLELLTEEVTGTSFAGYMETSILLPLGMENSTFIFDDAVNSGITSKYLLNGKKVPSQNEAVQAHGGLYTNVEDLARFVAASVEGSNGRYPGGSVLSASNVRELHLPVIKTKSIYALVSDASGMGHFIEDLPKGQRVISHGGQGTGTITWMYLVPEKGDGIVILTNSERSFRFIAQIVRDWSQWIGITPVGFSRTYSIVIPFVWIFIIGLVLLSLWIVVRTGMHVISGKRQFSPLTKASIVKRIFTGGASLLIIVFSLWLNDLKMFHIVLPVMSMWIIYSGILFAVVLFMPVLFPRFSRGENGIKKSTI